MKLLVGLGNVGDEYQKTRHNVGFDIVDTIAERFSFNPYKSKFKGQFTEGVIDGKRIYILKPGLFMNRSGISVREAIHFYKISLENVIVVHDDLDIDVGKIKVKTGGGAGGHNGLRSLDAHIGKEYTRVRLGISHPGEKHQVTDYVLKKFSKQDRSQIDEMIEDIARHIPILIRGDRSLFLTRCLGEENPSIKEEEET